MTWITMDRSIIIFVALIVVWLSSVSGEYAPIIQTKSGKVRGLIKENVHFYQAIRFGQAKRFARPEPAKSWSDIYDATIPRDWCPQVSPYDQQSEDCLFLNVWRPANATNTTNLPVMVWIYGGGFQIGSIFEPYYDGTILASIGQVVVVSVNYRLNAFGFLYAKDAATGNQGLYDQLLGLKWVQENIQQFGGDPKQVTIFGESAGSMSVGALINSPLTNGLFHRAILQSGYSSLHMRSREEAWKKTLKLASLLHCNQTEPKQVVDCLREKSIDEIKNNAQGLSMYPVSGDELLPVSPDNLSGLSKRLTKKIDLIFGSTHDEGGTMVQSFFPKISDDQAKFTLDEIKTTMLHAMENYGLPDPKPVVEYFTKNLNASDLNEVRLTLSRWVGQWFIICPTMLFGKEMAKIYGEKGNNFYGFRLDNVSYRQKDWRGVVHGSDVPLVFGIPLSIPILFTQDDQRMSSNIVHAWTRFAKTGQPGNMDDIQWTTALDNSTTSNTLRYLSMAPKFQMIIDQQPFMTDCETIWRSRLFD